MRYDVAGLGNPLVDILAEVDDEFLRLNGLNKGIMHLIEKEESRRLIGLLKGRKTEMESGGDCPNTITTLARLGLNAAFTGKVGYDELGGVFEARIAEKGVHSFLRKDRVDTGTSVILITPDKERTMNTHLGACREYGKEDLPMEMIENSSIFYFTGYMWDTQGQKEAAREAIRVARAKGVRVAFDVADPFAAERYREDFLSIIGRDVDILFANAHEARILTGCGTEDCARSLGELCPLVVVKNGEAESFISHEGRIETVASFKTDVRDTTGAGDNFAAGFLFGLVKAFPVESCGRVASFVASKTIEKVGAQAPENIKNLVEGLIRTL
jgi:sugar/nucleoside kinase (ribokinase family)